MLYVTFVDSANVRGRQANWISYNTRITLISEADECDRSDFV